MDSLLSSFTKKYVNILNDEDLICLSKLIEVDDENLYKFNQGQKTTVKFDNNNVIQHDAAAKALGMSREQLALRILASAAEVDPLRIRRGLLSLREQERVITTIGELSDLPVYIDDTPFQGIVEMRSKARRLSLEQSNGLDMVVIDYLQLIQGEGRGRYGENRVQEISDISRSIKGMARDLNIPVITCSQLSRVVENRPGHRPQLSDLRDSGSIEQDADIVMFIYREDLYYTEEEWEQHFPGRPYPRGITELIVSKHRHGQPGSIKLLFHGDFIRFEALPRTAES